MTWERGVSGRRPPNGEEAGEESGLSGGDFIQGLQWGKRTSGIEGEVKMSRKVWG